MRRANNQLSIFYGQFEYRIPAASPAGAYLLKMTKKQRRKWILWALNFMAMQSDSAARECIRLCDREDFGFEGLDLFQELKVNCSPSELRFRCQFPKAAPCVQYLISLNQAQRRHWVIWALNTMAVTGYSDGNSVVLRCKTSEPKTDEFDHSNLGIPIPTQRPVDQVNSSNQDGKFDNYEDLYK
jgi:hypothetical protein